MQVVQACHAAYEAGKILVSDPDELNALHLVVLAVHNETKLRKAAEHLNALGIRHCSFSEPDLGDQMTSIATEPIPQDRCRIFRKYQCLKCECGKAAK